MSKYLVTIPVSPEPTIAEIGLKINASIQVFADNYNRAIELATNYLSLRQAPCEATIYELVKKPVTIITSYRDDKEVKFTVKELNSDGRVSPIAAIPAERIQGSPQSETREASEAD